MVVIVDIETNLRKPNLLIQSLPPPSLFYVYNPPSEHIYLFGKKDPLKSVFKAQKKKEQ